MENVNGVMPVYEMNKNDGMHDGSWFMWIVLLLILLGGNGFGNNNSNGNQTAELQNAIYASNDQQTLMGMIRNIGNGLCDSTYALNNAVQGGFANTNMMLQGVGNNIGQAIAENRFAAQSCCCETNRNIDALRFNSQQETTAITDNATYNTQRILDKLCQMEGNAKDARIAELTAELQNANLAVSQQAQNATLINALRPFPQPAYITCSPYQSTTAYTTCPYNS